MRKLFLLLFLISSFTSIGQEPMRVLRSDAVSYSSDVINIHVTQENVTYVSTERGVFRIYDVNLGEPLMLEPSEESLLAYPGGNALISWEKGALDKAMGAVLSQDNQVTTTYYDADKDELWVGTTETGIFVLATKPRLSLKRTLDNRNSRLRSNYINTIHRDFRGTFWIGTQYGVLKGKENRWELLERDFNIESIATDSSDVWFLGSNLVGYVDRKGVWYPIELPRRATEGRLKEVAIDQDGQIWIASEVITRYDPELDEFSSYGPATYYTSQYASTLRINQDSALWVGTEDKGLYLIEKASAMTVSLLVERDLSCAADDPGGVLEARVKGGREPYQYKWSVPAFTGSTADQLQPGIVTVEVTDAGGKKKTATAELLDPRLSLTLELQEAESEPNAADGRAKVNVSGGQPGYRYAWDNGETLGVASKLKGGVHRVTVTDTKGCSEVGTINIPQNAAELIVDIEAIQKPACSGLMTGALQANVSGGRMPYTYEWSTGKKSPGISQIGEGTYQVTITDAVGTTQMATLLLIAPLPIVVESTIVSPASTNQFNGQANLAISGGVEPYAIRWDNGDETEQTSRLGGGKHTVTVTDGNGCTIVSDVLVPEDILPIQAQIEDIQPISCPGAVDGSLLLSVTGGKPPYSYSWNTPAFSGIQGDNLPAGKYTVTIVDASGQSVQTSFDLEEPEPVQAQVILVAPATTGSNNGQAEVSVTGGQSPYQYRWDNGETEALAQQLTSGEHSVTITDKMGCTAITEISISENVLPLTLTLKQTQLLNCA
ncbi:MAG: hypothetical protein HRU40_05855, partial [Saprospiraceae bacterium]|nr:hypothetical protein [Saprospiraceae bacterium]